MAFHYCGHVAEELLCCICHTPLYEPRDCPTCRNSVCAGCLAVWLQKGHSCPQCRAPMTQGLPSTRALRHMVDKLEVKCHYHENGCTWTGPRSTFHAHVARCNHISADAPPIPPHPRDAPEPEPSSTSHQLQSEDMGPGGVGTDEGALFSVRVTVKGLFVANEPQNFDPMDVEHDGLNAVSCTIDLEYSEAAATEQVQFGTVNLKAGSIGSAEDRVPLDLVLVMDKSGSMTGQKIKLVKSTVAFIAQQLGPADRLALVLFNSTASTFSGLRAMTEENRAKFISGVQEITAEGGTNIIEGLSAGLRILRDRRDVNLISTVLLLTDGQDRSALSRLDRELRHCPYQVNSFGFGADHDVRVMAAIAEKARGSFTFIEREEALSEPFAEVVGGLVSSVAKDIAIDLVLSDGIELIEVMEDVEQRSSRANGEVSISLQNMFAEEERNLLFSYRVAANGECGDEGHVRAQISYVPLLGTSAGERVHKECAVKSTRIVQVRTDAVEHKVGVNMHRNRVMASRALKEAAETIQNSSRAEDAKEVLTAAIRMIENSPSARADECVKLREDLVAARKGIRQHNKSRSSAHMSATSCSLRHQRSYTSSHSMGYGSGGKTFSSPSNCIQERFYRSAIVGRTPPVHPAPAERYTAAPDAPLYNASSARYDPLPVGRGREFVRPRLSRGRSHGQGPD